MSTFYILAVCCEGKIVIGHPNNQVMQYALAFRELVNSRVTSRKGEIKDCLRVQGHDCWGFICSSMDIIQDASMAIKNFLQFGLNGPCRYSDLGEKYLRLYGILSAVYIQQQAVLELYERMKVENKKDFKGQLDALSIRQLRHKLASHGTDYKNGGEKETFVPVQYTLSNMSCTVINNLTHQEEHTDLSEAISQGCSLLIDGLYAVYEKSVKTLYKGNTDKQTEWLNKIAELCENSGKFVTGEGEAAIVLTLPLTS